MKTFAPSFKSFFGTILITFSISNVYANNLYTDAKTFLEIAEPNFTNTEAKVSRDERGFTHFLKYQSEATLDGDYIDEMGKTYAKGSQLFGIKVEGLNNVYCAALSFEILGGQDTQLRCFADNDSDGIFDEAHAGYINHLKPITVNAIRNRKEKTPANIPYTILEGDHKNNIGELSFGYRNSRQKPSGLGIFVKSGDYEQFMFKSFIKSSKGSVLTFKNAEIEVTNTKKRSRTIQINEPITAGTPIEIISVHKTVLFKVITTSNIVY